MILDLSESEARELQRSSQRMAKDERRAGDEFQIAVGAANQKFAQARLGARQEDNETVRQLVEAKGQSFDKVQRYTVDLVNKKVILEIAEEMPRA